MSESAFSWDVTKDVYDSGSNSLFNVAGSTKPNHWMVVYYTTSKQPGEFDHLSSYDGTRNNTWTADFVFEEYTETRITPEAGKYYYIYCQNLAADKVTDISQYLSNSSSTTLNVTTSKSVDDAYIWRCVSNTSGSCILKNVSTNNYLDYNGSAYDGTGLKLNSSEATMYVGNSSLAENAVVIRASSSGHYCLIKYDNKTNHAGSEYNKLTQDYCSDFVFLPVKTVTFSEAVSVNGRDAVSTMYVATDGSDVFTLDVNKYYTINEVGMYAADAVTTIAAAGTTNINVTVSNLPTYTVTYTCNNLSGYQLASSTQDCAYFVPPTIAGYTLDGVYDDTDADFDYENTMITEAKTLNLKYHLTTNPIMASTIGSPVWFTIKQNTGSGDCYWNYGANETSTYTNAVTVGTSLTYPIADTHLWCFIGNETSGYRIYNKAQSNYFGGATTNNGGYDYIQQGDGEDYWTLIYLDGNYYFYSKTKSNFINRVNNGVPIYYDTKTYSVIDNALMLYQTNYPYTFIVNSAGCVDGYSTAEVDAAKTAVDNTEPTTVDNYAAFVAPLGTKLTLTSGNYYRVVSAVPGFAKSAAWYFNNSTDATHIRWIKNAVANHPINTLFQFTGSLSSWSILCPNAQKSMNGGTGGAYMQQNGGLDNVATAVTLASIGSAQYTFKQANNGQTLAANGHNNGEGSEGYLWTYNDNGVGGASAWYLMPVSTISIPLNMVDSESYGTMYLPFGVTLGDGADAYYITIENGRAKANLLSEKQIPAGTPVLLRSTTNASSVTATINDAATATTTGNKLVGTYTQLTSLPDGNNYILGNGDVGIGFYKLGTGKVIGANKAYLNTDGIEVKSFALGFDEDGISGLSSEPTDNTIYDMVGRRVQNPARGLYIVNGKKVIVK